MRHFNGLTPAEQERLVCVAEEMGEAIQAIGKILRHGYGSKHPKGGPTNRETLAREMGDVYATMYELMNHRDVNAHLVQESCDNKPLNMKKYLHHYEQVAEDDDIIEY